MSDKPVDRIHFGSLEHTQPIQNEGDTEQVDNNNMVDLEHIELDNSYRLKGPTRASLEHHLQIQNLEQTSMAKSLIVPTDDNKVKSRLRELNEPITLFGERPGDRRLRLRMLMAGGDVPLLPDDQSSSDESEPEEFYTIGSDMLRLARVDIGEYSLPRARQRLQFQLKENERPIAHAKALRQDLFQHLRTYGNYSSQIGDDRPLTQTKFSPDSKLLATGSWSGLIKLWQVPNCEPVKTLRGHTDRIGGLAFHPNSTITQSKSELNLASGGADGMIHLWNLEQDTPIGSLVGHESRVSRVAFHPTGKYLASSGYDTTWRLFDVSTTQELLMQEGHSKEVYTLAFQDDGALIVTGGLDSIGRVWDLRTGRSIMELKGHVQDILGLDFAPNSHQIASSSADNTIKIWDVRTLRCIYTIPAHKSIVSNIQYYRGNAQQSRSITDQDQVKQINLPVQGLYLASSGYDGNVKFWSGDDYRLIHSLQAHESRVFGLDVSKDNKFIVSGGFDRTFKFWSSDDTII